MSQKDIEQAISRARDLPALNHECGYDCEPHDHNAIFLNEAETRYFIIDPILRALGWDLSDPDQASFEYRLNNGLYIDYVLYDTMGNSCIILESKALGNWRGAHERQLRQYVQRIRNGYAVLTNGRNWKVWNLDRRNEAKYIRFERLLALDLDINRQSARTTAIALNRILRKNLF